MVAAAMTPRTRVVMPVHLYGQLADIEPIRALCAKNNLLLLEDAAQAHGARLGATSAGMFGDAGASGQRSGRQIDGEEVFSAQDAGVLAGLLVHLTEHRLQQ